MLILLGVAAAIAGIVLLTNLPLLTKRAHPLAAPTHAFWEQVVQAAQKRDPEAFPALPAAGVDAKASGVARDIQSYVEESRRRWEYFQKNPMMMVGKRTGGNDPEQKQLDEAARAFRERGQNLEKRVEQTAAELTEKYGYSFATIRF